ncbi:hypothetical protein POV27_16555 [Aureisphaera galaxeae]|uniref:hypothetical protein n=1 Tax=Aureisphaera galaxeae TaxID=1538023 RepID=UPI0023503CEC|nr:hypothetical protein [Aureisphaera galaxeae]MDC8005671.1 hypothetical protein [Aureisphaera galaxeae]
MIKRITSLLTLKDTFIFNGSIEGIHEKMRNHKSAKLEIEWIHSMGFKFMERSFLSSLRIANPSSNSEICGYASLTRLEEYKTEITVETKPRYRVIIPWGIVIILLIVGIVTQKWAFHSFLTFMMSILFTWSLFGTRIKEKQLLNSLRKHLQS